MSEGEPRRPRGSRRTRWILAGVVAVATVLAVEVGLWLWHPLPAVASERFHKYLPAWGAVGPVPGTRFFDPGPLAGVTPGLVEVTHNRYGFLYLARKAVRSSPDEIRIAAIGGSTVECAVLQPAKRWTAVLERRLREAWPDRPITVLNLGVSAQDTRTHMATVCQHVTSLDVDLVVFMLGANDLFRSGPTFAPMVGSDNFHVPKLRFWKVVRQWSQIGRHLSRKREPSPDRLATVPYFHDQVIHQASLPIPETDMVMSEDALADYERNLVTLAGVCREHGIAALFANQPTMLTPSPTAEERAVLWGFHAGDRGVSPGNFVRLLGALNDRLLDTCRERGYASVDLARVIPKGLEYFYDQVHFNERGAAAVAAALVDPVRALIE